MSRTHQRLRLEDLRNGMRVNSEQLSDIYNIHFILIDPRISDDGSSIDGELAWFGRELNNDSEQFNQEDVNIACIYNTDDTSDGEIYYED